MKKLLLFPVFALSLNFSVAQVTWSDDAAQVFYNNCTVCHNPNGIAPTSFMTYNGAFTSQTQIQGYIQNNIMPPWTADTSFQHYFQERLLTQTERDIILNWISDGAPEGNSSTAPPPPVYNGAQVLPGIPDLVVEMDPYMSKATSAGDDYICIALPTNLTSDKKVKAIEVIPGNRQILHHCLVFKDPSATYVSDTIGGNCSGPSTGNLMGGYAPGSFPIVFPGNVNFSSGMILEAGSNVILAMHYPEGSYGEWDQTKVNFYFYDEPVINFREVMAEPILQDWSFNILANTTDSVEVSVGPLPFDYTVMSALPHMHLIGKYIDAYAITPSNDTVPFVRIPNWDFEWQDIYWMKYLQHVPAGSTINGKGVWDNLAGPNNPNDPPQNIGAGLNTSDEMFLVYFHYMNYQSGDEYVNVDSLNTIYLGQQLGKTPTKGDLEVYPNPFIESTTISYSLQNDAFVSLYIYDMNGRLVNPLVRSNQYAGEQKIVWNGTDLSGNEVSAGIYVYSVMIDGEHYHGKIIKH